MAMKQIGQIAHRPKWPNGQKTQMAKLAKRPESRIAQMAK